VRPPPPITLEQLAEVTARIDLGTPREAALRKAAVPAEMWELAQQTWMALMAEEVDQTKPSLRTRYTGLLAEYRARALEEREAFPAPPAIVARPPLTNQEMAAIMAVPENADGGGTLPIPGQARRRGEAPSPPAGQPERTPGVVAADQKRTLALSAVPDPVKSPLPPEMTEAAEKSRVKGQVDPEQKRTIALSAVPDPGDALPFQTPGTEPTRQAPSSPAPPMPAPQLTLAQYARVCVEMWKAPARGAEICARYGIPDARGWAAVNQLWQERIHADPTLKQRWLKLTERMQTPRSGR
jgi:hypothetical protein